MGRKLDNLMCEMCELNHAIDDRFRSVGDDRFRSVGDDRGYAYNSADVAAELRNAVDDIEDAIDGMPGDPGKMYSLQERVRRVMREMRRTS